MSTSLNAPDLPSPYLIVPFKVELGDGDHQNTYTAWTKFEFMAPVKGFPDPEINSLEFEWHFHLIISVYQPGFSDLYLIIHMFVGTV